MTITDEIMQKLYAIEKTMGVEILFAAEAGSRAWGMESKNSDYDIRFIYKRPLSWYLSICKRRDVIESPDPIFDISGWDLKKALLLLSKSNPPLLEWLSTPSVYIEGSVATKLREFAKHHFNPAVAIYHYLHMANGNYRTYLRGEEVQTKKYLYVIRPLFCCQWLERHHTMPPVFLGELVDDIIENGCDFPKEYVQLLAKKMRGEELDLGPRIDSLNSWIETKLDYYAKIARTTPKLEKVVDDLDEFFFWTVK